MVAFCEPVAYNFLYYLQIIFTKDMTWKGEKGIINMRKSYVFAAMKKAGLCDFNCVAYGFFPPFITNTSWGDKIEQMMEKVGIFGWGGDLLFRFLYAGCRIDD